MNNKDYDAKIIITSGALRLNIKLLLKFEENENGPKMTTDQHLREIQIYLYINKYTPNL